MKNKMDIQKFRWFLFPIVISVVLILCECYLSSYPINSWNISRWITVSIIIAVCILAALFGWGGKK